MLYLDYQFEQYAIDPNYYQYQMNTTVDTNPMAGIMPSIPNILYPQEYANMNVYNQNIGELPVSAEIIPQPTTEENIEGEGYYDKFGFFYFPDGSFIDPDGFKFDKNGFDASGGYYDENLVYVPAVQEAPKEVYVEPTQTFDPDANNEYYDEDDEDKYTKAYIEYVLEHKLIENLDYVQNSPNEYVYLMAGNMREGVTQQEITDYFNLNKIDTSQMTIAMNLKKSSTVARLEIYNKEVALSVLKLWGTKFKDSKLVIEVDEENERYYYGGRKYLTSLDLLRLFIKNHKINMVYY